MPLPGGEKGLTVCAFVTDRRKDRTDKEISPAKMIYITCEGMGPRHLDNSRQDALPEATSATLLSNLSLAIYATL